jgi:hypothetical protein
MLQKHDVEFKAPDQRVYGSDMTIEERAVHNWPGNVAYQRQWIASVTRLREASAWVLDGAPAKWGTYDRPAAPVTVPATQPNPA